MISLKKVDGSIFPRALSLLPDLQDQYLQEEDWKILFNHRWERQEEYCGYGLFDEEELVGFIGLIFSLRKIAGEIHPICNLTSWVVKEPYRDHSLSLLLPVMRLEDYTITDLSASEGAFRILKRLGFKELDQSVTVVPCLPSGMRMLNTNPILSQDPDLIRKTLNPDDLEIYNDHVRNSSCNHFILQRQNRYCYIVASKVIYNTRIPYSFIHYVSHPEIFSSRSRSICTGIARSQKTNFVAIDSRHATCMNLPLFHYNISLWRSRLYKSPDLKPDQVDNLYSELVLLNFSTFPSPIPDRLNVLERIISARGRISSS